MSEHRIRFRSVPSRPRGASWGPRVSGGIHGSPDLSVSATSIQSVSSNSFSSRIGRGNGGPSQSFPNQRRRSGSSVTNLAASSPARSGEITSSSP